VPAEAQQRPVTAATADQHQLGPVTSLARARLLALAVPAALLAGALGSQYLGGLYPCEMCHWQRWGHYAALGCALLSLALRNNLPASRLFIWLAVAGIAASGMIGVYHAGVEAKIFEGFTQCTATVGGSADDFLAQVMNAPLIRCTDIQWSFLGISMAGWNALISLGSALLILLLLLSGRRRTA
jgi:disulfide bond formation protein DsbB